MPPAESLEFTQRSAFEFPSCNSAWPELTKTKGSFSTGCSEVWSRTHTNVGCLLSARSEPGVGSHQLVLAALHHHLCLCGHPAQPQLGCARYPRSPRQTWSLWKGWKERRRPEVPQEPGLPAGKLAKIAPCEQGGFNTPEVQNIHLAAAAHDRVTVPGYSVPGKGDHQHTDIRECLLTRWCVFEKKI